MGDRLPRFSRRWMPLLLLALLIGGAASWSFVIHGVRSLGDPPPLPARRAAPAAPLAPAKPHRAPAAVPAETPPPSVPARPAEPPGTRDVRITVVAEDGGSPVEDAVVHIDEIETFEDRFVGAVDATTDALGVATVKVERGPTAYLSVGKRGRRIRRRTLDRDAADVRVTLAAGIPLAGRVLLAESGEPVGGVAVRAWDSGELNGNNDDAELDAARVTSADGRFELAGVPAGRQITIVAAKSGFRTQSLVTTVTAPGPEVEMLLGDGGVMFGTVCGEDGRPLPGVEVLQMPADTELPDRGIPGVHEMYARAAYMTFLFPPVVTDAAGRYEFRGVRLPIDGVPQPRLAVARRADGHTARGQPATFTQQGERQQRDVRFAKAPTITVRVKSSSPLPKDAQVRAQRNGPTRGPDVQQPWPKDGGPVTFRGLTPGLYFVSLASGDRFRAEWDLTRQVTVAAGEDAAVEFVVDDAARIAGQIVDTDGRGVAGMRVEFDATRPSQDEYVRASVVTVADGAFALDRLLPIAGLVRVRPCERIEVGDSGEPKAIVCESVDLRDVRPGGAPLTITLRRLGRLTGRVTPVPAKRDGGIGARTGRREGRSSFEIGDDGRFECDAPFVGEPMQVWIGGDGGAPVVLDVPPVPSGETRDLGEIALTPGFVLDGKLVDAGGNPLASAEVRTLERWMKYQRPTTGADGRFRIERVPKRPLVLRVGATPTTPETILVVADPSVSPAAFTIAAGALVEGRVLDANGDPIPNANVTFFPGADLTVEEDAFGWTQADAAGRYSFRLQAGHGRVHGYDPKRRVRSDDADLTVADGEKRTLDLVVR